MGPPMKQRANSVLSPCKLHGDTYYRAQSSIMVTLPSSAHPPLAHQQTHPHVSRPGQFWAESPSKVPNWLGLSRTALDLDQTCKTLEDHKIFVCKLHQQICPYL